MIIVEQNRTEPYFNLAAEQYLLDSNIKDSIFMLWRNEPSVIIGRNQNAYSELNQEFIKEHNIKVVRRLTGGGAVFHDLGNINFTFIVPKDECETLDFKRFTTPVIEALSELGVKAELSGRNDITVDGIKISGNAQCRYNNKIMHHGTLLFDSDISRLSGALNVDSEKLKSKGIQSVRSRVANLKSMLNRNMDVIDFKAYLEKHIEGSKFSFKSDDISAIQNLADSKYSAWEWTYGESKSYSIVRKQRFPSGTIEVNLNTEHGIITSLRINGDYFGIEDISGLESILTGEKYEINTIKNALEHSDRYIAGVSAEELLKLFL